MELSLFFHISLLSSDWKVIMGENNLIWGFICNQNKAKDNLVVVHEILTTMANVLFTFVLGYWETH